MNQLTISIAMFFIMTLITSLIYPVFITGIAHLLMSSQADGSLIYDKEHVIGSSLIAQSFTKKEYFWPRPSAIQYNPIPSGGSNLGPTSQQLKEIVNKRAEVIMEAYHVDIKTIPVEMVYASGSGLDPHISIAASYFQVPEVARARSIDENELTLLIDSLRIGRQGVFKESNYVNVLQLNLAMDKLFPKKN